MDRLHAQGLVPMTYSRRYQDGPLTEVADIQRVYCAPGPRAYAKITKEDLEHTFDWNPQISLLKMEMDCLDGVGISHRGRDLHLLAITGNHLLRDARIPQAGYLKKETAIIRIDL